MTDDLDRGRRPTMVGEVLVTGATGFIGRALVRRLTSLGRPVTVLSRTIPAPMPAGVRVIRGDLSVPSSLPMDLLQGIDTVFHCAGELRDVGAMRRLHVDGTRDLLDCMTRAGRGDEAHGLRWIQLSSVGAYGPPARAGLEREVVETSPENPCGEYEITKTEADHLLIEAAKAGRIALTILRPSNVFGPGMPNRSLPSLLRAIRRGLFFYIGSRDAVCTYVHVEDVASALIACAENRVAAGKIYILSNDCTLSDLVNSVADAAGRRRPWLLIPEGTVRTINDRLENRYGWPLTSTRIDALVSRTRYPSALIRRELGYEFPRSVPASLVDVS